MIPLHKSYANSIVGAEDIISQVQARGLEKIAGIQTKLLYVDADRCGWDRLQTVKDIAQCAPCAYLSLWQDDGTRYEFITGGDIDEADRLAGHIAAMTGNASLTPAQGTLDTSWYDFTRIADFCTSDKSMYSKKHSDILLRLPGQSYDVYSCFTLRFARKPDAAQAVRAIGDANPAKSFVPAAKGSRNASHLWFPRKFFVSVDKPTASVSIQKSRAPQPGC